MEDKLLERLTEMGATEEDLANPEKVKELAEKVEAENKAKAEEDAPTKDDKILEDQLGRLRKALMKGDKSPEKSETPTQQTLSELDVDNRVFARSEKLSESQIDVLREYAQLERNKGKSFEEIYNTSAVQAEMKELKAAADAADEIDANASEDKLLESKNEIYEKHTQTGQTPETEYEHKVVVEKSLEAAGFREY